MLGLILTGWFVFFIFSMAIWIKSNNLKSEIKPKELLKPLFPRLREPLLVIMRNGGLAEVNEYCGDEERYKLKGLRAMDSVVNIHACNCQWTLMGRWDIEKESEFDIIDIIGVIE